MPRLSLPNLSPRQRQILELIRQGKSNNEIAFELGIGLGTVKQHVVALFRRLKVTSRTMALSQGNEQASRLSQAMDFGPPDVILQRRPCIVLSMTLAHQSGEALREMKTAMAVEAQEAGDIFLPWREAGCDVILGIDKTTESTPLRALQTAWQTAVRLAETSSCSRLKGGLAAGLAVASMYRRGGWSGEAIASSAIVLARQQALAAGQGTLRLDSSVHNLLRLCGAYLKNGSPSVLPLNAPEALQWHNPKEESRFFGRSSELDDLQAILTAPRQFPGPRIHYICGDAGIGKSRLCLRLARLCRKSGHPVHHIRCLPVTASQPFWNISTESPCTWEVLQDIFPADEKEILIVDDAHWLGEEQKNTLMNQASHSRGVICLVQRKRTDKNSFLVPPLSMEELEGLLRSEIPADFFNEGKQRDIAPVIATLAGGNPLFALEMARHQPALASLATGLVQARKHLPLSLLLLVTANLDQIALDSRMLSIVASMPNGIALHDLVHALNEEEISVLSNVDEAIKTGILSLNDEKRRINFVHPMFHNVIHYLGMEA